MSEITFEMVLVKYVALKAAVEAAEALFAEAMKPQREAIDKCMAWFLAKLNESKLQNVKVEGIGTIYKTETVTPKIVNLDAFEAFVETEGHQSLIKHSPDMKAIKEFLDEYHEPPPGVEVSYFVKANVRRA